MQERKQTSTNTDRQLILSSFVFYLQANMAVLEKRSSRLPMFIHFARSITNNRQMFLSRTHAANVRFSRADHVSLRPIGRHSREKELIYSSVNETILSIALAQCQVRHWFEWRVSLKLTLALQRRFIFEKIPHDPSRGFATVHRISCGQHSI